jgi:HAD superfamily hydrolase (TIGR01509 family)
MIQAVVFDLDGLIVDTEQTSLQAWEELYREVGLELPLDRWKTTIGTWGGTFDPVSDLGEKLGRLLAADELQARREREWELASQLPVMPGVIDHLDAANAWGLSVGVASSSSRKWVHGHLERLDLVDRFDCICSRDDVLSVKPDPSLYYRALLSMGVDGQEAIAYEDCPNGLIAAKSAGLHCVVVPGQLTSAADYSQADAVLESLADVDPRALWDFIDAEYS